MTHGVLRNNFDLSAMAAYSAHRDLYKKGSLGIVSVKVQLSERSILIIQGIFFSLGFLFEKYRVAAKEACIQLFTGVRYDVLPAEDVVSQTGSGRNLSNILRPIMLRRAK